MPCLSDEEIFLYFEARLPPDRVTGADHHLATCAECCALLAETAKLLEERRETERAPTMADSAPPVHVDSSDSGVGLRGTTLGRYEIEAVLGRGGMSVVYSAVDAQLHRKVAIKLVRPDVSARTGHEESKMRLLREARAMARLAHPNVVAIYDVGEWEEQIFISMELVAGGTLRSWLRRGPRPWREILDAFLAAGEGLAAAHACDIVHRDFKPENVLVGADGRVRVTDFGLARPARVSGEAPRVTAGLGGGPLETLTQTGDLVGTPAYMSPEQFLGSLLDARTDEYSFCVALYEALYGKRPFDGIADVMRLGRLVDAVPPVPPEGSDVPRRIYDVLARGLRPISEERYPSMRELLVAVEEAAQPELPSTEPPPLPQSVPAPVAARGRRAVMFALVPMVVIVGLVLAVFGLRSAHRGGADEAAVSEIAPEVATFAQPPAPAASAPASAGETAQAAPDVASAMIPSAGMPRLTAAEPPAASAHTPRRKPKSHGSKARVAPLGDKVENPF